MTDIQTIKQIEKELNIKLEKVDEIKYNTKKGYTLNEQAEIIELGLYECEIKDLNRIIDFLKDLKSLTTLNLRSNNISDISFLKDLKNLTTLDLSANEISDISVLKDMKSLTSLNLSFNQISDISVLKNLKNLTNLNLERNQITNISVLKELKNLIIFDGEHNMISNIKSLNSLSSLQQLYLSVNKISDISPLKYLRKLERVDLNSNKIKILPKWISNFSTMEIGLKSAKGHIGFGNNPLRTPPIEIVKQGKKAINNYFASLKIHNKELKLILLGNTTAGKTSLVQYLTEKKYPPKKTTHGIELTAVWQPKKIKKTFFNIFKKKKPLFSASIWDFGGQEYYHATHRLFLTNNSFYILLWDKNQNKTAILPTDIYTQKGILENKKLQHFHYEYWLKLIRKQFAPGAEIITVQNKTDISGNEIIAQQTVDNYKIKAQYQISIEETAKGTKKQKRKYTDFEEDLKDYITEFIKSQAPEGEEAGKIQRYIDNIRKAIRNDWNENYFPFNKFKQKAKEVAQKGGDTIDDFDIEITLKYLHDTGVLLYYGYEQNMQNSILQDFVFIDPNYVTGTIYNILNEESIQKNGGKLDFTFVKNKVDKEEIELFIALMQSPNFELIFNYDDYFYASQFLPKTNDAIEDRKDELEFAFALKFPNFFSQSFITRFISRYGSDAEKGYFCQTGIMLKYGKNRFYISANIKDETITVKTSEEGKKHEFIRKIYDVFVKFAFGDKNVKVSLNRKNFASLEDIEKFDLKKYRIDRLSKPIENKEILKNIFESDGSKIFLDEIIFHLSKMRSKPSEHIINKGEDDLNERLYDFLSGGNLRNKFQFRYEDIAEGRKDITLYENNIEKSIIEALIQKSPQSFKNHVEKLVGRYNQGKHNFTVLLTYCKKENFLNEWGKYQEWHSDLIKENKKHHKLKIIDNKSLKADQNFKFAYSDYKIDNGRITRIYHIFVDFTII